MKKIIQIPYIPRPQFLKFHERPQRFACLVIHRRGGKTVASINELIKRNMQCEKRAPRYAYIAPYHAQAKDVAWEYLKYYSSPIPGVSCHEGELRVDYPNGGRIRLYGAENAERMRGLYFDGVVIDEPADIHPGVWPEIVRPALSDRQGWACFIGTPKGHNNFYDIHQQAQSDPQWFHLILRASESGLLHPEELSAARKNMSEDQYAQEFECSFEAAIIGAYYGKLLSEAEAEARIHNVSYDPALPVHTIWDLGMRDATSIWFMQRMGQEIRLIDYYEKNGNSLAHHIKALQAKPYLYGAHILPHDVEVKELSTGVTRLQTMNQLGLKDIRIAPRLSIEEGISAARLILPRCWFDRGKCKEGLEALKQYRHEFDERLKVFRAQPLHDWTSHAADAFRYLAISLHLLPGNNEDWQKAITYDNKGII